MSTPAQHIESIRKKKFSIGRKLNPLNEDLHEAVKIFSAELYSKDVHFLMELIQNAEDNDYAVELRPSLEFIITSRDITGTGASATLLIFNNEKGFSPKNIDSICSVGRSTKKGRRNSGYIGEKGIGFKSVFLVSSRPHVFSNGYQIRFNEEACPHCHIGYIVPEWVHENPSISDVRQIYGETKCLPATTIILPLKGEKVSPVKKQLASVHAEFLLFLSKIRSLSYKEEGADLTGDTLSEISISSETNFVARKNIDAESYSLHLIQSVNGGRSVQECSYHMWRQRFPVIEEHRVERRMEVEEWSVTLAFPFGERLRSRGADSVGVYAYLPTRMVTDFPFIIQADFLLASSRETILLDNKWNRGILGRIPTAFVSAFRSLVITRESTPDFNIPSMFRFVPIQICSFEPLNAVKDSIRSLLIEENIIICESVSDQRMFCKPREARRLMPTFWAILCEARSAGISLHSLSSHGVYVLNSLFDSSEYDPVLNFLGIVHVDSVWYARCISSSNFVLGLPEGAYMGLLQFVAENWSVKFEDALFNEVPLLRYIGLQGNVAACTVRECGSMKLSMSGSGSDSHISWLIDWMNEFKSVVPCSFIPKQTQRAIYRDHFREAVVLKWLKNTVGVLVLSVYDYAYLLKGSLPTRAADSISFVHLLHHSLSRDYLSEKQVRSLCSTMPLVDKYQGVVCGSNGVLVPARGSKWSQLIGVNVWRQQNYLELREDYLHGTHLAGRPSREGELTSFLRTYVGACDLPDIVPPDSEIPTLSGPLTKENVFLLLDWIRSTRNKRASMPTRFMDSIKKGCWLRILLGGTPGFKPPSESFFPGSSWGSYLQNDSLLVEFPLIDEGFYGSMIVEYKEELRAVGVRFEYGEACAYMGERLMALASASTLTRSNVFSILNFIRFLRQKMLPVDEFVGSVKGHRWLRTTTHGDMEPSSLVLFCPSWKVASEISDIPFIAQDYYGCELRSFKAELELLGVITSFNNHFEVISKYLKFPPHVVDVSREAFMLVLECMRHLKSQQLIDFLKGRRCVRTISKGPNLPSDCFLIPSEWERLLGTLDCFAMIDVEYYGSKVRCYVDELRRIGVVVCVDEAVQKFTEVFKQMTSKGRELPVLNFLAAYRTLQVSNCDAMSDLKKCLREVKWLRTRLCCFCSPKECILYSPEWKSISQITLLPFLADDEGHYGEAIHEFRKELEGLGVVLCFKDGGRFILRAIRLPADPSTVSPSSVYSLLDCIRTVKKISSKPLPDEFLKKISASWVKTSLGHMAPSGSMLYGGGKWVGHLRPTDGPFLDQDFYGPKLSSYKVEMKAIGVVVDDDDGSGAQIISSLLGSDNNAQACDISYAVRIYSYLKEASWVAGKDEERVIWIPSGHSVEADKCRLHDRDGLFGSRLSILEEHYPSKLLPFFGGAFGVKSYPSLEDYCKLWRSWEEEENVKASDCCAFLSYMAARSMNARTKVMLEETILKVPVLVGDDKAAAATATITTTIRLVEKMDAFIPDDLHLKDLFDKELRPTGDALFVWFPRSGILLHAKLLHLYREIGVRALSEFLVAEVSFSAAGATEKAKGEVHHPYSLKKGVLLKLVGGYLGDPKSVQQMETERRHEIIGRLTGLTVYKTDGPIRRKYSLGRSSGKVVTVCIDQMLFWERHSASLFVDGRCFMSGGSGSRSRSSSLEYATCFSKVISQGLLWDEEESVISPLAELLKVASLVDFDDDAVDFLMKTNNLRLFHEDEGLLSSP